MGDIASFSRWNSICEFLDVIASWPCLTAMLTGSCVWALNTQCSHCGNMTIVMLRWRLEHLEKGGVPSIILSSGFSAPQRDTFVNAQSDLWIVVQALPLGQSPRASCSSHTSRAVEFPDRSVGPSHGGPSVSFGAPVEDQMSIAASGGLESSGDEDSAALPPSGRVV